MAEDSTYISDLNPITEIQPEYSLIVETDLGTERILWKDVIVGADNVDFYNEIVENTTNINILSTDVATLSAGLSALQTTVTTITANNASQQQNGFCYAYFDDTLTFTIASSSSNISAITFNAGTGLIKIQTTGSIDFTKASINVTLDSSVSSNDVNSNYISYFAKVAKNLLIDTNTYTRGTNVFYIGIDVFNNIVGSISLPTAISTTPDTISYVSSVNATNGTLNPVESISTTTTNIPPTVVTSVTGNTVARSVITAVAQTTVNKSIITAASITTAPTNITNSTKINYAQVFSFLKNVGLNISFRY